MPEPLHADVRAPDPRFVLREATAGLHAQVDALMPLAREAPTLADYRSHLALLARWLRQLPLDAALLRQEAEALALDLRECDRLLGVSASVPASAAPSEVPAPAAHPDGFGWGVRYVLEGSKLGGQVLFRRLAGALAPHPLGYLRGAGRDVGARWSAFLAELREHLVREEQLRAACEGAVHAFELLLACRREAAESA